MSQGLNAPALATRCAASLDQQVVTEVFGQCVEGLGDHPRLGQVHRTGSDKESVRSATPRGEHDDRRTSHHALVKVGSAILDARVRAAVFIVALLLALTGCAPGTPDEDSWRYDARRAVGDVVSAVQTARLVLTQSQEGRVHHAYVQNLLVDAERLGGMAAETLSSVQPPDVEHRRSSDVDDQLERATGLLTDARIAVVAHETDEYADLVTQLERMARDLLDLEAALEHPPEEAR
jgi:hypothetical protein